MPGTYQSQLFELQGNFGGKEQFLWGEGQLLMILWIN